jgi:hypothetical protein
MAGAVERAVLEVVVGLSSADHSPPRRRVNGQSALLAPKLWLNQYGKASKMSMAERREHASL